MPRSVARLAAPGLVRTTPAVRSFASAAPALNRDNSERHRSAPPEGDEYSSTHRLNYLLAERLDPSQELIIRQMRDSEIDHLPLVFESDKQWQLLDKPFTFPRRDRSEMQEGSKAYFAAGDYVYNTFHFSSVYHLKRFNREIAEVLETKARLVVPIGFFDVRSRTYTVGLPAYIGIRPPYPSAENSKRIIKLIDEYRSKGTPTEAKKAIMNELRTYIIPRGFRKLTWVYSRYLIKLYESLRKVTSEQILADEVRFRTNGELDSEPAPQHKDHAAQSPKKRPEKNEKAKPADGLQADNPRLPEADIFVAPDGDAHKGGKDEALKDHVPFPKPSAEEMGMKREGGSPRRSPEPAKNLQADDSKLPEAGTFVAPDGDAHKVDSGEKLEDRVPFPQQSAEKMWNPKPVLSQAERLQADDPKLPEAGTFVAPNGDAHKADGGEKLEDRVPFPQQSAEEMWNPKPVSSQADDPKLPEAGTFVAPDGDAHKVDGGEKLEDRVPFPQQSAEEMWNPKPVSNQAERLQADDPKLPEAGTFVAPNGDAHKADGGEKLEDRVPFPQQSAEEMWNPKPVSNQAERLQADDPKLPEAGTFVAPDGGAHKPSKGEGDALEEHVPFPKPSAEEMGIKRPTEG
ncbi:hypothetical protein NDA11_005613 [Ustilago hordei]|nr:hypothetical protein NDA11_005613 [Ustilago hordei]KAJ1587393.1 hypothetical protein NDA15_005178 [Ustilago hordei]UTT96975.1 hypothetical protein NDA17_002266 [Ustilago hordei]